MQHDNTDLSNMSNTIIPFNLIRRFSHFIFAFHCQLRTDVTPTHWWQIASNIFKMNKEREDRKKMIQDLLLALYLLNQRIRYSQTRSNISPTHSIISINNRALTVLKGGFFWRKKKSWHGKKQISAICPDAYGYHVLLLLSFFVAVVTVFTIWNKYLSCTYIRIRVVDRCK